MSRRVIPFMASAAATLAMASVQAQALTDPTRPPQANAASSGEPQDMPGTQLQSVLISSGRKLAIINGTMVPLGGMLGEAKVVKITESEVVLQKGSETEVLKLFPGVDKQPVKRGAARARGAASIEKSPGQGRPQ